MQPIPTLVWSAIVFGLVVLQSTVPGDPLLPPVGAGGDIVAQSLDATTVCSETGWP